MEREIIYTHNRNWYVEIKDEKMIIKIPIFYKFDKNLLNKLIEKWEKLAERQKKYEHIKIIDDNNIKIFWEDVEITEINNKNLDKNIKKILLEYVTPLVDEFSEKLWYGYKSIHIWKAKTKWWSCSFDQKIMFNINLVHLPTKYIKYVVIHEVCHLKHKNHSDKFRAEVEWFLPDHKKIRKELKHIVVEQ